MSDPLREPGHEFGDLDEGALRDDLRRISGIGPDVSASIDDAILNRARAHFSGLHLGAGGRRLMGRRAWIAAAAAVAIISGIAIAIVIPRGKPPPAIIAGDVDRNGRVDMLDAFALARRLEADESLARSFDLTADGAVDEADVEWIARRAVALDDVAARGAAALWPARNRNARIASMRRERSIES